MKNVFNATSYYIQNNFMDSCYHVTGKLAICKK